MSDSGDVVVEAQAALEGVTEGPWEAQDWDSHANGDRGCGILAGTGTGQRGIAYTGLYHWNPPEQAEADAKFVTWCRDGVPRLIAEVQRWRAAAVYAHDDNGALQAMTAERDHWESLWRQNLENASEAMRERDEALARTPSGLDEFFPGSSLNPGEQP